MMGFAARVESPATRVWHSIACRIDTKLLERILARCAQRHEICDRSTAYKQSLEFRIKPKQFAKPSECYRLEEVV